MIAKLIAIEDVPFPLIPEALTHDKEITDHETIIGGKPWKGADFFIHKIRLTGISREEFIKYWNERLDITKTAYGEFEDLMKEREEEQKKLEEKKVQIKPIEDTPEAKDGRSKLAKELAMRRWHPEQFTSESQSEEKKFEL